MNKVIVIAFNSFNSYGIVRSLGEGGIRPYLILSKNDIPFVAKSKWAGPVIFFSDKKEITTILMSTFTNESERPIVICCDDPLQAEVDSNFEKLSKHFILANCSQKAREISRLMNKNIQMQIASESGLSVPKSWYIGVGEKIPQRMIYPCIAKPYKSIAGSKKDIRICRCEEDLAAVAGEKDYTVQQFIEKDYEVILWGTSIGNGDYYIPGVTKKIRQFPNEWGMSSYCVLESFNLHPGLNKDALYKFLKALNYTGMFSIEMAVKNGEYYFLEINLRNYGKQYFSTAAGANLPLIYIKGLLKQPFIPPKVKLPTYAMGELTDYHQLLRGKVSFCKWLRDLFRTKCFFILNFGDLKPFIYQQYKQRLKK